MSIDSSAFPFVWMRLERAPGNYFKRDYAELDLNLNRREPFVLLTDTAPPEGHQHTQEEKKFTTLWMKNNKAELRKHVLAMVFIEPQAIKRLSFKSFAVLFTAFWGYPLIMVKSHHEAIEIAEKLLLRRAKQLPPER